VGITEPADIQSFKDLGLNFNFYLARQIKDPSYSEEWKLYYPKDLLALAI